jgi:hypothetical protein
MYTLQGKTRPTCHTPSTLSLRMIQDHTYLTWSMHSNPSWDADSIGQSHSSREKGLPTQSTTCRLIDPWVCTQFLSRVSQWRSGESQTSVDDRLLGLPDPYHRHAIGTFNTCSRGPTHGPYPTQVGARTLEVAACHVSLPDLPNQLTPLSPKGPARSPV